MENRIKFLPNQQKIFIENVYKISKLSTKALAQIAGVHQRSFSDWRSERLTMTLKAAELFCKQFNCVLPEDKKVLLDRWKKTRKDAGRIGGQARFKIYGSPGTKEGRKKGGKASIRILRKKGLTPLVKKYKLPYGYNEDLAEFTGIMLGDGGITSSQCTITLNSQADKDYARFVSNLAYKLFAERPKIFKKKDCNAVVLYYYGVYLIEYLRSIGLKVGNKVRQQVDVPDWIKSSILYKKACLRGLMDTDGGIFIHKYKVNNKEYRYKKISFSNRSIPLLMFVNNALLEFGFTPKLINKVENKKVWLYNESEVGRYLKIVRSNNLRLSNFMEGDSAGYETGLLNLQGE